MLLCDVNVLVSMRTTHKRAESVSQQPIPTVQQDKAGVSAPCCYTPDLCTAKTSPANNSSSAWRQTSPTYCSNSTLTPTVWNCSKPSTSGWRNAEQTSLYAPCAVVKPNPASCTSKSRTATTLTCRYGCCATTPTSASSTVAELCTST